MVQDILIISGCLILIFTIYLHYKNRVISYEKRIKRILKNYGSILVKSDKVVNLGDKQVIEVIDFEGMLIAQQELRKPIQYFFEDKCCNFLLFDNNYIYVYILRDNSNIISTFDAVLERQKQVIQDNESLADVVKNLDRTAVLPSGNLGYYKISPVSKKRNGSVENDKKIFGQNDQQEIEIL